MGSFTTEILPTIHVIVLSNFLQEVTGSGAQGVTSETVVVPDSIHSNYPQWIDNPGKIYIQFLKYDSVSSPE